MSEFWAELTSGLNNFTLETVVRRLLIAWFMGLVAAAIHWATQSRTSLKTSSFGVTLVLLTIIIAMVTMVIGDNQARAFSLVGALAIVRFRTVVEDTRDTAFVIFGVTVGMAAGAGFAMIALAGIPIVAGAAFLMQYLYRETPIVFRRVFTLTLRVNLGTDPKTAARDLFEKHVASIGLEGIATVQKGAAFDVTYRVQFRDEEAALVLVRDLNQREGIQSIEVKAGD